MANVAPSGVVSFLMTDVEDSTRLWESDPVGMAASLAWHDELCRRAVAAHDGYTFSTAGDAFAIAFTTPDAAVDAALTIQAGLEDSDWSGPPLKVRMGIHTGTAEERDGDYFGPSVNRAARVMSAGHGGHLLISGVTAELLRGRIGSDIALVERGRFALTGFTSPERIFEVAHPGSPPPERPLRTRALAATNLSDSLSSFVGRESELSDISRRLDTQRLIVLTGPGGTGKTRLAAEVGRRMVDSFPDGAWLVELAPLTEPERVMSAIGDIFGLRPGEQASIDDVVVRHLSVRRLLLLIDNCEHVLDGAADAIRQILARAPDVRVLATSRESLGVDGESVVQVPPLAVPAGVGSRTAESVVLFCERAASAVFDFDPSPADHEAISRICRRVDGIPLALELAAARLRSLSTVQLADRLDESIGVLAGSSKSGVARHRTLETTIDWSYQLLEVSEREIFRRLSVFVGGFDLEGAEAVAGREDVFDLLDSLVDKSLVVTVRTHLGVRFRMLEPIRQFAARRLEASGEFDGVRAAHASHFVDWVRSAAPGTRGEDQVSWDQRIDADYDNIRTAFRSLLEAGPLDSYLQMAFDLFMYWVHSGLQLEAIETCLDGLRSSSPADSLRRVKVWFVVAAMGAEITSPDAIDHARSGLEIARELDDANAIGRMELALGAAIRHSTLDPSYLEHLLGARAALDAHPEPPWWEPRWDRALTDLLLSGYLPSSDERSLAHGEAAITTFERLGDRAMMGAALVESVGSHGFDSDRTVADLRRAIEIFDEVRAGYWQAHALLTLGTILRLREDHEAAVIHLDRGARQLDDLGDLSCWATAARWLSHSETALGMSDPARRRLADVIERFDKLPMAEVALPRTLDALVVTLIGAGLAEEAATVLGCAKATPFPVESVIPRSTVLDELADRLGAGLGVDRNARLQLEGAEVDPREMLERARQWLVG